MGQDAAVGDIALDVNISRWSWYGRARSPAAFDNPFAAKAKTLARTTHVRHPLKYRIEIPKYLDKGSDSCLRLESCSPFR